MLNVHESNLDIKFVETPFWFWVKAGIGFTLGAGLVTVAGEIIWWTFLANLAFAVMRALGRH